MKKISLILSVLSVLFFACKKDKDTSTGSKVVKYELTGTYSGKVSVGYANEDGVTQIVSNVTLPWSKEVTVKSGVSAVALVCNAEVCCFGTNGQTLTGKISVGGDVKKSTTVNTTSDAFVSLSGLSYTF